MDLVKAFNLIPRQVIKHIFQLLGIPSFVTNFWFLSLTKLSRALQNGQSLGPATASTTGLPEGDSMSVVGMLALSFVFHAKLKSPRLFPYAYADNWSFMSTSERECFRAMTTILNLITGLKMKIDFAKSWCWATTKQFKLFWHDASVILLDPAFAFQIKSHVHDLGCTISYNNQVVLGPLRDKIDNAIAKCNRLRKLDLTLDDRAEKIQIAIWPAVFYGALGASIGQKHFTSLRRAAATVLVGDYKHASSFVALHYLSAKIQDPMLYLITDMLTTLRRYFLYYPNLASQVLQTIRAFDGKVRGPASALASYLRLLNWSITSTATLLGPGGLRINIPSSSNRQIKNQLRISWDWFCHNNILHRKGVPSEPFDSTTTLRLLNKLSDRHRRILALSLTSGWQSLGGIAQWAATQEPECPWCKQHDTHCHQLLDCPTFAELRAQHPQAITYMNRNRRVCWFPLPMHHPDTGLARQAMFLRHRTIFTNPPQSLARHSVIYTDGSCDDTRDPYTARAAWAAIYRAPHPDNANPQAFSVLACGHCPGHQTINRSELYAITIAVEHIAAYPSDAQVTFVTDSQFVADVIQDINTGNIWNHPHKKARWDLIQRLIELWHPLRFILMKIRSHQDISQAQGEEEAWHIYGNSCADIVAGRMRLTDEQDFSDLCQDIRHARLQERDIYNQIYQYLVDLALARLDKMDQKVADVPTHQAPVGLQAPAAHTNYLKQMQKLREWTVTGNLFVHPGEPHKVVFWCSPWGTNLTRMIWQFCQLLVWPCPDQPPEYGEQGISWTELAFSFMLWSQKILPVKIRDNNRQIYLEYDDPKVALLPSICKSLVGKFPLDCQAHTNFLQKPYYSAI